MSRIRTLLALLALSGCAPAPGIKVAHTAPAVGQAVQEGRAVRLADHTDFSWDTVHIFSPYTPREAVCGASVISWQGCEAITPEHIPEGEFLLVFSLDGRYVAHELHGRNFGDYCESSCALVIRVGEAVFRGQPFGANSSGLVHYVLRRAAA